jgi:hypothetical protein
VADNVRVVITRVSGKSVLAALGLLGYIVLSAFWSGYVAMVLWSLFVVPQFHLAPLVFVNAIGLALLVRLLTHPGDIYMAVVSNDSRGVGTILFGEVQEAFFTPLCLLAIGYIVHWLLGGF